MSEVTVVGVVVDGDWRVYVDSVALDPAESLAIWNHSPDGFSWGYAGSGPTQLAKALVLRLTGDVSAATRYGVDFRREFLEGVPMDEGFMFTVDPEQWHLGVRER